MRRETPNPVIIQIEKVRSRLGDTPLILTIIERKRVKKVKLNTNPKTTPIGRALPVSFPPMVEVRIIGRIGKIQGDSIVTIPAKNANTVSKII